MNRCPLVTSTLLIVVLVFVFALMSPRAHSGSGTVLITAASYDTYLAGEPDAAFSLLSGVFWHDWGEDEQCSVYVPTALGNHQMCVPAGENVWWFTGEHCCAGLTGIALRFPCDTPGVGPCDEDGCGAIVPCACDVCAPCGNDVCEPQYRENRCNCPADCGL